MHFPMVWIIFAIFHVQITVTLSSENGANFLDKGLAERICGMFNEVKCPYDDYCYDNEIGNHTACTDCPLGGIRYDCNASYFYYDNHKRYDYCPTSEKFYHKYLSACTWRNNCPTSNFSNNSLTIRFDEKCTDENCQKKTGFDDPEGRGPFRPFKCPNDIKCAKNESECNVCTSINGGDDNLCTNEYCNSLNLTDEDKKEFGNDHRYVKCPTSSKCILRAQICDGIGDCPDNEDEKNCSKEECQKMNKTKCPIENKCVENNLACTEHHMTSYPRNRCKYNLECVEKCLEQDETRYFCPHSNPSTSKAKWMEYNCPIFSQQCNDPDLDLIKFFNLTNKFWRCSSERKQYIPVDKVCDGQFDCLMNEDESENTCKSFPITMAISYSVTIVSGVITIMICLKSFGFVSHKFMCKKCLDMYAYSLDKEQWIKKRRLLTMLMGEECKEFVSSKNFNHFMSSSWNEQRQAYLDCHLKDSKNLGMKSIFKYITSRFEQKVTFLNLARVMTQRQQTFEKIYNFEIYCHGGDERSALTCLYKNHGGNIVDLKQKPTVLTKTNLYATVILKRIFKTNLVLPTIKMMLFVFDLTKDISLGIYLYNILFDESSEDRISTDDYYLFSTYITSLILGQLMLSIFCYYHRYLTVSICPHQASQSVTVWVSTIMIIFFPLTGIIMSTNNYMNERIAKDQFERISSGLPTSDYENMNHVQIDWTLGPISKTEYEEIMIQLNYTEEQKSLGGFELMKALESLIESFLQILLILVMFYQLPHEGILNRSIFAFTAGNKEEPILGIIVLNARDIFILTSLSSYIFVATGVVSFINILENGSLTIKEKLVLILIYLIRVGVSLTTICVLVLMKSETHENIGFIIWLSILGIKFIALSVLMPITMSPKKFDLRPALLILANINVPIQIQKFLQFSSKEDAKLDRYFLIVWILSAMESVSRIVGIYAFNSEEVFYKMFSPFSVKAFIYLVLLFEVMIFSLWRLFFNKIYIWRNLMTSISSGSNQQNFVKDERVMSTDGVCKKKENYKLEGVELASIFQNTSQDLKNTSYKERKLSGSLTCLDDIRTQNIFSTEKSCSSPCLDDSIDATKEGTKLQFDGVFSDNQNYSELTKSSKFVFQSFWKWDRKTKIDALTVMALFFFLTLFLVSILSDVLGQNQTFYRDCDEINIQHKQKDGFYSILLNDKPFYTYCKNGSTLIQRKNPLSGNSKNYFERIFKDYEEGFGFVEKEMFLGLKGILELNKINNTVLQIEGTKQDDGSKVSVQFDQFILTHKEIDDIKYDMPPQNHERNQVDWYPIISLGNQSSAGDQSGQFILINPSYLQRLDKKVERTVKFDYYHDLLYSSFTTFDMERNYECGRDFRSGWWFPFGLKYGDDGSNNEICQYTQSNPTSNLNGIFDRNETKNQLQLVHCLKEKVEDCIQIEKQNSSWGATFIIGWKYKNVSVLKLTDTKIWLKRSDSELGYKMGIAQKQPVIINSREDCYEKCFFEQGPCKWCGKEGLCCSQNAYYNVSNMQQMYVGFDNGCDGTFGGEKKHDCVKKPKA